MLGNQREVEENKKTVGNTCERDGTGQRRRDKEKRRKKRIRQRRSRIRRYEYHLWQWSFYLSFMSLMRRISTKIKNCNTHRKTNLMNQFDHYGESTESSVYRKEKLEMIIARELQKDAKGFLNCTGWISIPDRQTSWPTNRQARTGTGRHTNRQTDQLCEWE